MKILQGSSCHRAMRFQILKAKFSSSKWFSSLFYGRWEQMLPKRLFLSQDTRIKSDMDGPLIVLGSGGIWCWLMRLGLILSNQATWTLLHGSFHWTQVLFLTQSVKLWFMARKSTCSHCQCIIIVLPWAKSFCSGSMEGTLSRVELVRDGSLRILSQCTNSFGEQCHHDHSKSSTIARRRKVVFFPGWTSSKGGENDDQIPREEPLVITIMMWKKMILFLLALWILTESSWSRKFSSLNMRQNCLAYTSWPFPSHTLVFKISSRSSSR